MTRTPTRTHEALRSDGAISAYGPARSTVEGTPLSPTELRNIDAYWHASLYLCLGMLYLKVNPLLREPLTLEHIKPRLLGHWGSDAGQAFTYIHFNRLIKKYDLNAIYFSGPGHGGRAPGLATVPQRLPRRREAPDQISVRAHRVVSRARAINGDVLVFSHGHFLRVLAAHWLGLDAAAGRYFLLSTASLSALGYEENLAEPAIRLWDETRHVET